MDRVFVLLGGVLYTGAIVLAALAIVLFSSSLHSAFLTPQQAETDRAITGYLLNLGELPFMTPNEASHMEDVKWLATTLLYALAGLIALLTFFFAHAHPPERTAMLMTPLLVLLLLQIPLVRLFQNFTVGFEKFHQVFFPQGNYSFPSNSVLISTYNESFFASMAVMIILLLVLFFVFGLLLSLLSQIRRYTAQIAKAAKKFYPQYHFKELSQKQKEIEALILKGILKKH